MTWDKKYLRLCSLVIAAFVLDTTTADGQPVSGGASLFHCRPAWVLEQGHLTTQLQARFWGEAAQQSYAPFGAPGERNIWNLQSAAALNYGLGAHLEAQIAPVLYQSDQNSSGQVGHDISLALTAGSLQWPGRSWFFGSQLTLLLPVGGSHNLLFEPYSPGRHMMTITSLVSYASDADFPAEALNAHLNIGYSLYDDVGLEFSNPHYQTLSFAVKHSQNLQWGAGITYPGEFFDFGLESYGLYWLQKPPLGAEGREDCIYGAFSLRYKPLRWLHPYLTVERRLSADKDETVPSMVVRGLGNLPNYPGWQLQVGMQIKLLPLHFIQSTDRDVILQRSKEREPVFEQLIKDGGLDVGNEGDLERLREERERAEKELERLRRVIETRKQEEKKPLPEEDAPPPQDMRFELDQNL